MSREEEKGRRRMEVEEEEEEEEEGRLGKQSVASSSSVEKRVKEK